MSVTRTARLIAVFVLAVPLHGLTQETPAGKPAPSNVRGKEFPLIHPDRRVTFRVTAPDAREVAVVGHAADSGMNGDTPYLMKKRADGIWEVTTGPVRRTRRWTRRVSGTSGSKAPVPMSGRCGENTCMTSRRASFAQPPARRRSDTWLRAAASHPDAGSRPADGGPLYL